MKFSLKNEKMTNMFRPTMIGESARQSDAIRKKDKVVKGQQPKVIELLRL